MDGEASEAGRSGLRGSADELQQSARESGRDLLDQAVEKKDELKHRAGRMVDEGRTEVADRAGSLARALHGAATNLEEDGDRQLSSLIHQAADQVDRVAGYLREQDPGAFVRDMEGLARRNPALFLGGTYAAGMLLGRFLRAGSPERREERELARPEYADDGAQGAAAERSWPGSTSGTPRMAATDLGPDEDASAWTGVGVSRDSFGSGSGSASDDAARGGPGSQAGLGGTPGYGASGSGTSGGALGSGLTDDGYSAGRTGATSPTHDDGDDARRREE